MEGPGKNTLSAVMLLLLLVFGPFGAALHAQTTIIVEAIPDKTPGNQEIYISGDFEGWTGGQEDYRLKKVNQFYYFTFPKSEQKISFKFTRGNWDSVETDSDGNQIDNRSLTLSKNIDSLTFKVAQWSDLIPKMSTAADNVFMLKEDFDMAPLKKKRKIWICLPKDYNNTNKRYPVLYMHDGQNLFDSSLSFSGEWNVDETLNDLADLKSLEIIVIGIENGGSERIDEYTPWEIKDYPTKLQGEEYVLFIKDQLKPYVDEHFRTESDRSHTAIMGSSLGGLISYYAALQYPGTFGKAGIFSPSFSLVEKISDYTVNHGQLKHSKLYFMAGDSESEHMVSSIEQTMQLLIGAGFPPENLTSKIVEKGEHNEKLWRREFGEAIEWLFDNK